MYWLASLTRAVKPRTAIINSPRRNPLVTLPEACCKSSGTAPLACNTLLRDMLANASRLNYGHSSKCPTPESIKAFLPRPTIRKTY